MIQKLREYIGRAVSTLLTFDLIQHVLPIPRLLHKAVCACENLSTRRKFFSNLASYSRIRMCLFFHSTLVRLWTGALATQPQQLLQLHQPL